jgi:hypothetical protein
MQRRPARKAAMENLRSIAAKIKNGPRQVKKKL